MNSKSNENEFAQTAELFYGETSPKEDVEVPGKTWTAGGELDRLAV